MRASIRRSAATSASAQRRAMIVMPGRTICRRRHSVAKRRTSSSLERASSAAVASQAAMAHRDTSVSELCGELGISPVTLYRYVDPQGNLRDHGKRVIGA